MNDTAPAPFVRPDVAAFLAMLAKLNSPASWEIGEHAARAQMRSGVAVTDLPLGELATIRDLACSGPAGDVPLRLFDARINRDAGPVLVFFHGGGWVLGDLDTHAPLCAAIARGLDLPVVSVDYRLAPEHRYPAAPDDCEAAARWIAGSPEALGLEATGLVLAGDSAGGALSIITAMALRDAPAAVPLSALWPIYPAVDAAAKYPSYQRYGADYGMTRKSMAWFHDCYRADLEHWRGAPIRGETAGLPPTLVTTAALDPVVDQGRAFAAACALAGVDVTYREAAGTIHGFANMRKILPSAEDDLQAALALLKAMLAA